MWLHWKYHILGPLYMYLLLLMLCRSLTRSSNYENTVKEKVGK